MMTFFYSLSEINKASKFIFDNSNSNIILFEGDLGTGKTTLIKNLCYKLGSIDNVSSPTFPILNIYDNKKTKIYHADLYRIENIDNVSSPTFPILNIYDNKKTKIYHADLYRIENINDLNEIGFFDIVNTNDWLFVEWPKKIINLIDKPFSRVTINIVNDNERKLELTNK